MAQSAQKRKSKSKISKNKSAYDYLRPKDAKPEHYFILVTGVPLKNLKEVVNSFDTMNDWVFRHHVNDERNDFSNWIKDALFETELSEEILQIKDMKEMQAKILKFMINKYL